jgi:hypothetical protein
VYIETDSNKEEIFFITTSINYSEVMKSSTRGKLTRLVKSGPKQRKSIKIDNFIFFSHIFANVYHPGYVFQQKQHMHRSIFWTVNFPRFTPRSWQKIMASNEKIRISYPPTHIAISYKRSQAIRSGDLIRIIDVLGHLRRYKNQYAPLFLLKNSKKQLHGHLLGLRAIVAYTKANTEVSYDQLDEHDRKYLTMIDHELIDIEEMISRFVNLN